MGIFDQIKNAFGGNTDSKPEPNRVADDVQEPVGADSSANMESETHTVQSGDTLWKISEQVYGDGSRYMEIFEANTGLLDSPDQIFPGQELIIPQQKS